MQNYPFGMNQDSIMPLNTSTENRFQYNGKELEKDGGIDLSDYGARWYDAGIGRWTSVDPLASDYFPLSPYAYVGDNPIHFLDPDGRFRTRFGAWLYSVFNGGDVKKSTGGKREHKWVVKSVVGDGSEAGLSIATSWKSSSVKVGVETSISASYSVGEYSENEDNGNRGFGINFATVQSKYTLYKSDQGLGYGNEYLAIITNRQTEKLGMHGAEWTGTFASGKLDSPFFDIKGAVKAVYDFDKQKWIDREEFGLGMTGLEAKIIRQGQHGKFRFGIQEDFGKTLFRGASGQVEVRSQIYFKW